MRARSLRRERAESRRCARDVCWVVSNRRVNPAPAPSHHKADFPAPAAGGAQVAPEVGACRQGWRGVRAVTRRAGARAFRPSSAWEMAAYRCLMIASNAGRWAGGQVGLGGCRLPGALLQDWMQLWTAMAPGLRAVASGAAASSRQIGGAMKAGRMAVVGRRRGRWGGPGFRSWGCAWTYAIDEIH